MQGGKLKVGQDIVVKTSTGKSFTAVCRLDTDPEIAYFQNGGILHYVLRKLKNQKWAYYLIKFIVKLYIDYEFKK